MPRRVIAGGPGSGPHDGRRVVVAVNAGHVARAMRPTSTGAPVGRDVSLGAWVADVSVADACVATGARAWRTLWPEITEAVRAGTWGDGGRDY